MITAAAFSPTQPAVLPPVSAPQHGDIPEMLAAKAAHILGGGSGVLAVNNTAPQTARVIGFIVLADTVFSATTGDTASGYTVTGLTGKTLGPGMYPFRLSGWTLASGSVLAILA